MDSDKNCNSSYVGAVATEEMTCGLCKMFLFPSPLDDEGYYLPTDHPTYEGYYLPTEPIVSTVAMLSCGHVYHADCLEQITTPTDKCDPKCPLCHHSCPSNLQLDSIYLQYVWLLLYL